MSWRCLITGLCGFIGHHVADYLLENTDAEIVGIDRIDATSTLHRLRYLDNWEEKAKRVTFIWHDLRAPVNSSIESRIGDVDVILHLAASTHVDRSIGSPLPFIQDNVLGTFHALELARRLKPRLFVYFSTDEVFGPAIEVTAFKEWDGVKPHNPYAATKAAGADLAFSYYNTYGVPVIITQCMNVVGKRQHPEKFLPKIIRSVRDGQELIIHTYPDGTPGSRVYLSAHRVAQALHFLMQRAPTPGFAGDKFNLAGEQEVHNLELAAFVAEYMEKDLSTRCVDYHSTRPGHDLRYGLDGQKLRNLGFNPEPDLWDTILETVDWTLEHPEWLVE